MLQYSDKHKHLEFLQSVINRLAGNLFLLKGWTVTLIAALFALAAKDANARFAAIAYFPLLIFWAVDGYFLAKERCFRALYDYVRTLDESQIDFSMDCSKYRAEFPNTWPGAMFSRTLLSYYIPLAVTLLTMMALT